MELCETCERLISMREDQGDYYLDKPYCHNCLEKIEGYERP